MGPLFAPLLALAMIPGSYFETSVPPPGKEKTYRSARYRMWAPRTSAPLRGLLIKHHGCGAGAHGLPHASDIQWQALALKHNLALLAPSYDAPEGCDSWTDPLRGSAASTLAAIERLAEQSGHLELRNAPWAIWGHSGGAAWGLGMLFQFPERTIGLVASRCGSADSDVPSVLPVPVLFVTGTKDPIRNCVTEPMETFTRYRARGALWSIAPDPVAAHENGNTRQISLAFLDAVLAQRLPAVAGGPLRRMDPASAWLGRLDPTEAFPAASFPGNASEGVWLPDGKVAGAWLEYVRTGWIAPRSIPDPPSSIRVEVVGPAEVELTWHSQPNIETGLPVFGIYRNGGLIGAVGSQRYNFHDSPQPTFVPEHRFVDTSVEPGKAYQYRIAPLLILPVEAGTVVTPSSEAAAARQLAQSERADLVAELRWWPESPDPEDHIELRAVISNRGRQATPAGLPVEVVFRLSGVELGTAAITAGMPAGSTETVVLTKPNERGLRFIKSRTPASYRLSIEVDHRNRIMESYEENNLHERTMEIGLPPSKLE